MFQARRKLIPLIGAVVPMVAAPMLPGCSSQQSAEPVAQSQPNQTAQTTQPAPAPTEDSSGYDSLLGATAHFVWTVVAFPFRVVGDVLGEIV